MTPKVKGIRTGIQAFVGIVTTFIIGLFTVVWSVEGVPEAVTTYLIDNAMQLTISLGVSGGVVSGIVAFIQNYIEEN